MPAFVKTKRDEKIWEEAKKAATDQYGFEKPSKDRFYAIVNKIYHTMKGEESKAFADDSTDGGWCSPDRAADDMLRMADMIDKPRQSSTRYLHDPSGPNPDGVMAKSQLHVICEVAGHLNKMIIDADELPGWVHSHITVAQENLEQVMSYMEPRFHKTSKKT